MATGGVLGMTIQYLPDPRDLWSLFLISVIHRPLVRFWVCGVLFLLFLGFGFTTYLIVGEGIAAAIHTMVEFPIAIVLTWIISRPLVIRVFRRMRSFGAHQISISQHGLQVSAESIDVKYPWSAVSRFVLSKTYAYFLIIDGSGYPFRLTQFETPELASRFCREAVTFISPGRIVCLDKQAHPWLSSPARVVERDSSE
jgi:hypothetical protein